MNADGTGRETVANHWGSPRWSPRGNYIASVLNSNIALLDLTTATERTILRGPHSVGQGFAISPDGLRFCFGDSDGGVKLATLDERTMIASVRTLVKSGNSHHVSFSPDGKRVVIAWQPKRGQKSQLYIVDLEKNEPPAPIAGQDQTRNSFNPDWSPNGKTIVFASQQPAPTPADSP